MERALMHTNSHAKLFTGLTIDLHMTMATGEHALDDIHGPFIDIKAPQVPLQDLLWHMIECFLKVDKGKVERFVGGVVENSVQQ